MFGLTADSAQPVALVKVLGIQLFIQLAVLPDALVGLSALADAIGVALGMHGSCYRRLVLLTWICEGWRCGKVLGRVTRIFDEPVSCHIRIKAVCRQRSAAVLDTVFVC